MASLASSFIPNLFTINFITRLEISKRPFIREIAVLYSIWVYLVGCWAFFANSSFVQFSPNHVSHHFAASYNIIRGLASSKSINFKRISSTVCVVKGIPVNTCYFLLVGTKIFTLIPASHTLIIRNKLLSFSLNHRFCSDNVASPSFFISKLLFITPTSYSNVQSLRRFKNAGWNAILSKHVFKCRSSWVLEIIPVH